MRVAVDVAHHVRQFVHLALADHAALDLREDVEDERVFPVGVDVTVNLEERPACEVRHIDDVALLFGAVAPVPVLTQERLALGLVRTQPEGCLLHGHVVVFLRVIGDVHRLLREMLGVPAERMPRQLKDAAGALDIRRHRVPDHGLNREAGDADVALPVIHLLIPHDLGHSGPGDVEILRTPALELADVVQFHDILHDIVHIVGEVVHILTLGDQHRLRRVIDLIGDTVVQRGLQGLQLEHLIRFRRSLGVLLRVLQAVDQAALPGVLVERGTVLLPQVEPGVGLPEEFPVLVGQFLLTCEEGRVSRAAERTLFLLRSPLIRLPRRRGSVVSSGSHCRRHPPPRLRRKVS